jgi:hypothetical protein
MQKISSTDISGLLKLSDIILIRPANGLMIPSLSEMFGIRSEKEFFSNENFNSVLRNKKNIHTISIGGKNTLVTKEIFINFLSLVLERSSKNGVYKQLPIRKYSKFERDLYDEILHQGAVSKKSLVLLFGLSGKKSRKLLDDALMKLWERFWIMRVDFQKEEGSVWQAVINWDKTSVHRALKVDNTSALKKIISAIVRGSKVITRPQIRRLLKGIVSGEEVDKVITALLRESVIDVSQKVIVNGKKGLIFKK